MKQLTRHITFLVSTLLPIALCIAQVSPVDFRDSLYHQISLGGYAREVFRLTYDLNSSEILYGMGNNNIELTRLASFVQSVLSYPEGEIERIRLTGYSSVEGYYSTNESLARERAYSLLHYLRIHFPEFTHYRCDVAWVSEDWEGLSQLVKNSRLYEREEVLEIIRKIPIFDGRESLLMFLNGGRAYREMERTMFPLLRRVELEVEYSSHTIEAPVRSTGEGGGILSAGLAGEIADSVVERLSPRLDTLLRNWPRRLADSLPAQGEVPVERRSGRRLFSLKTNLLSWIGIMPDFEHTTYLGNIALEYYITPRWSVELGAMYSYWKYNNEKEFQGISGYYLEPRWWVPLFSGITDLYLGPYIRLGDYDIRRINKTNGQADDTESYTGRYRDFGLSTGFYIYLTPAWGIELGARSGYIHSGSTEYTPRDGTNWLVGRKGYYRLRLTGLNVSLVYRFR